MRERWRLGADLARNVEINAKTKASILTNRPQMVSQKLTRSINEYDKSYTRHSISSSSAFKTRNSTNCGHRYSVFEITRKKPLIPFQSHGSFGVVNKFLLQEARSGLSTLFPHDQFSELIMSVLPVRYLLLWRWSNDSSTRSANDLAVFGQIYEMRR